MAGKDRCVHIGEGLGVLPKQLCLFLRPVGVPGSLSPVDGAPVICGNIGGSGGRGGDLSGMGRHGSDGVVPHITGLGLQAISPEGVAGARAMHNGDGERAEVGVRRVSCHVTKGGKVIGVAGELAWGKGLVSSTVAHTTV